MFLLILLSLFFPPSNQFYAVSGKIENKTYSVKYEGKENYQTQIDSILLEIELEISNQNPNSILQAVNANEWPEPAPWHLIEVYNLSQKLNKKTKGYFDPTVGPILQFYGFYPDKKENIWEKVPLHLLGKIKINKANLVEKLEPEASFDFGAIYKGYMSDYIADFLNSKGCDNYLIELGGVIVAKGKNQQKETWKIEIENPLNTEEAIKVIDIDNAAIGTTGSFKSYKMKAGKKVSHVIDPKTGLGVDHSLLSVTVKAKSGAEADAYATAFLAMGLEKAKAMAKKQKLEFYAIYEQDNKLENFKTNGFMF